MKGLFLEILWRMLAFIILVNAFTLFLMDSIIIFYQIDTKEKKLVPMMYLDFGDAEVKAEGLPGQAGGKRTDSDEERREITKDATERYQYLKKIE